MKQTLKKCCNVFNNHLFQLGMWTSVYAITWVWFLTASPDVQIQVIEAVHSWGPLNDLMFIGIFLGLFGLAFLIIYIKDWRHPNPSSQ